MLIRRHSAVKKTASATKIQRWRGGSKTKIQCWKWEPIHQLGGTGRQGRHDTGPQQVWSRIRQGEGREASMTVWKTQSGNRARSSKSVAVRTYWTHADVDLERVYFVFKGPRLTLPHMQYPLAAFDFFFGRSTGCSFCISTQGLCTFYLNSTTKSECVCKK